jgi:hypothetical protein
MRRSHETGKHGDDTPCDQYSRNPDACSDAVQQKIAGNFKDGVAEKEDSGDESVLLARNRQFLIHCQGGKSDVVSVKGSNDEQNEDERNDVRPQLADYCDFDCAWSKSWTGGHVAPPRRIRHSVAPTDLVGGV